MPAEVPDDLEQALLRSRVLKEPARRPAGEEPFARESQRGVVLAGGPREVARFRGVAERGVAAGDRPRPEPGEDYIHGQVRESRLAEQGLRLLEPRGLHRPVPRPELIRLLSST